MSIYYLYVMKTLELQTYTSQSVPSVSYQVIFFNPVIIRASILVHDLFSFVFVYLRVQPKLMLMRNEDPESQATFVLQAALVTSQPLTPLMASCRPYVSALSSTELSAEPACIIFSTKITQKGLTNPNSSRQPSL